MNANQRARAREKARSLTNGARQVTLREGLTVLEMKSAITQLANAIDELADVSEAQEGES